MTTSKEKLREALESNRKLEYELQALQEGIGQSERLRGMWKDSLARLQEAHQELSRSEATSRSLLESTAEGIIGIDHNGLTTFVNPAAARLLGYTPDELLGERLHPLVHHSYPDGSPYPPEECPMYRAMREGVLQRVDDEFLWCKDGSGFPVVYSSSPIFSDEQISGAVIAFTDITRLIQAEKELAESKTIGQSNELKRSFIANVSHELRTPLNVIVGMEHMLSQEGMTPKQGECIDTIHQAGRRLNALINGMLEFSQLDAGKAELDLQPTDLRRVLADVAAVMQGAAQEKGLQFTMDVDKHLPAYLLADGKRIGKMLTYITDNAIKFTQSGAVTITVTALPEGADTYRVVMMVEDTGIGMDQESARLLSQDFIQADSSLSRRYGGIGLGLTISRNIINLMGGSLSIESESGRGTRARIELLLNKAGDEEIAETTAEITQFFDEQAEPAGESVAVIQELTYEQCMQLKAQLEDLAEVVTTDYPSALVLMTSMVAACQGSRYIDALQSISSMLMAFETEEVIAACRALQQKLSETSVLDTS